MNKEREIAIERGVFALGIAVMPDHLVKTMRTSLDEMHGADWAMVPYSLARSMFDTMEIQVRLKLRSLGGAKMIVFDTDKGELRLTPLGKLAMKKLAARIAVRH